MSTAVKICSDALVMLGLQPINSLSDITSDRQRAAANLYEQVRDSTLRSHPWNCALKRVILSPDSDAPAFGWDYKFTLPGDCLRVMSISESRERIPFEKEGNTILCDESAVYLRYVYKNTNPATYDATLFRAMTLAMAVALAPQFADDKRVTFENELLAVLKTARAVDGQEEPPDTVDSFPLLEARH